MSTIAPSTPRWHRPDFWKTGESPGNNDRARGESPRALSAAVVRHHSTMVVPQDQEAGEMGNLFVPIDVSITTNPKIKRAAKLLGVDRATVRGNLVALWTWSMVHAKDGILEDQDPDDIARAADWTGDPHAFVDALIESGLLDSAPLSIHDWSEYGGKVFAKALQQSRRENDSRRQALHRNVDLREAVRERDQDQCRYCGRRVEFGGPMRPDRACLDHVDPSEGNVLHNLVVACLSCNSRKSSRTPEEAGMRLIPLTLISGGSSQPVTTTSQPVTTLSQPPVTTPSQPVMALDIDKEREERRQDNIHHRVTPPSRPVTTPCQYEDVLGEERIEKLVAIATNISVHLDRPWFLTSLRDAHRELGDRSAKELIGRLRLAFDAIERQFTIPEGRRGYVYSPASYSRQVLISAIREGLPS